MCVSLDVFAQSRNFTWYFEGRSSTNTFYMGNQRHSAKGSTGREEHLLFSDVVSTDEVFTECCLSKVVTLLGACEGHFSKRTIAALGNTRVPRADKRMYNCIYCFNPCSQAYCFAWSAR